MKQITLLPENHWLKVILKGELKNTDAIGARDNSKK